MNDKPVLVRWLVAEFGRMTGRRYRIDWAALDVASLREVQRLLLDLEHEKRIAANRARDDALAAGLRYLR
jgi:hypothetical protein